MADSGYTLSFTQLEREISTQGGESIFQAARRQGVRIVGACGGRGTCGTCVIHVVDGEVEHADRAEAALPESGAKRWVRACLVQARADCRLEVAPRSLAPVVRAEVDGGGEEALPLDAAVRGVDLQLAPATLEDNASDVDRVLRALDLPAARVDLEAARELSGALRADGGRLRVHLHGDELIGAGRAGGPTLGLAVDLGTTNAAAFLIDLASGRRLASLGIENPQVAWGADVIARINHAATSATVAAELRAAAIAAINALAHDLCRAVGARREDIADAAICGNTAMHHILLGLPVFQLGSAPFVACLRQGLDVKASQLGLNIGAGAYAHIVPNVGGFVGGDHVAALIATERIWGEAKTSLVMDIGTNTEISLIHGGRILSASCPSGPALEGGHISCGMRAAEGAIERVDAADGRIALQVIGGGEPVGLCGSGVLDALATLQRIGMMNERGRLAAEHEYARELDGKRAALLAPSVHFTQDDVRAVQLAKAAIRAGVELLVELAGAREQDIDRFIIAGAFGAYIAIDSAVAIGLLPDLPRSRFLQVGNAAGLGVRQLLASRARRTRAAELAASCRYVELSTLGTFQRVFVRHIDFPKSVGRDGQAA